MHERFIQRNMAADLSLHQSGRSQLYESPKRVRARIGDTWVADSQRACLVLLQRGPPSSYLFPHEDVRLDLAIEEMDPDGFPDEGKGSGAKPVRRVDARVGGNLIEGLFGIHAGKAGDGRSLSGLVSLDWNAVDAWYEEDEEVHVHPRDPYHRVDALASSRRVEVEVEGVRVARSDRPVMVFETGLPTRYYLPPTDVEHEFLRPSSTETSCPYKGDADYFHVVVDDDVKEDLVWRYQAPLEGVLALRGLLCFFNEKVDITIDGEREERPKTPWS